MSTMTAMRPNHPNKSTPVQMASGKGADLLAQNSKQNNRDSTVPKEGQTVSMRDL